MHTSLMSFKYEYSKPAVNEITPLRVFMHTCMSVAVCVYWKICRWRCIVYRFYFWFCCDHLTTSSSYWLNKYRVWLLYYEAANKYETLCFLFFSSVTYALMLLLLLCLCCVWLLCGFCRLKLILWGGGGGKCVVYMCYIFFFFFFAQQ